MMRDRERDCTFDNTVERVNEIDADRTVTVVALNMLSVIMF